MFKEWGFLISEMVVLILLAALLGLFVGWLIWGRRRQVTISQGDMDRLQSDLDACRAKHAEKDARIADLEAAQVQAQAQVSAAPVAVAVDAMASDDAAAGPETQDPSVEGGVDYDGDGVIEGANEGSKPETLNAARGGVADDLKQIKGIGPKLEILCNDMGFFHFDQIANWSPAEVAWVNANLEGFKGRVSRDNWIEQAKVLARGDVTEFSKRVEGGDVY